MAEQSDQTKAATQETAESATVEPEGSPSSWESPADADRRAHAEADDGHPEVAVLGAFVGAFVAAKLLGRLGGGSG